MWRNRLVQYLTNPEPHWPTERQRQPVKVRRQIAKSGHTPNEFANNIAHLVDQRRRERPLTFFVINCGSSGSHWLTTLLSELPHMVDCGEVYIPPSLLKEMESWPSGDRTALIDGMHLAQAPQDIDDLASAHLINSAHKSGWNIAAGMGREGRRVFLVRDPVDIALSRSFRKPERREYKSPKSNDSEYLRENIDFVLSFFHKADGQAFDSLVRYEDLRADPERVLRSIATLAGLEPSAEDLTRSIEKHGIDAPTANKYRGPSPSIPADLRAVAESELAPLRQWLGYDNR